jgi:hypothetical protein
MPIKNLQENNPPKKPRLLHEVRENFKSRITEQTHIGALHKEAVLAGQLPLSSAEVPTARQLSDMKYHAAMAAQPTGNVVILLIQLLCPHFYVLY